MYRRLWLCAVLVLSACSHWTRPTPEGLLAELPAHRFEPVDSAPMVRAWVRYANLPASGATNSEAVLRIYLEGDGAAWWAHRLAPADPSPSTSVALRLAVSDAHRPVAYLARPCQFLDAVQRQSCPIEWWTSARWGPQVLAQAQQAIDALKRVSGAQRLQLIGHSGGGTLAVLLAASRSDVGCLVTLASPLDIDAWADHHRVARLQGSLNPADLSVAASSSVAVHFFGDRDATVPVSAAGRYAQRLLHGQIVVMTGHGHTEGWLGGVTRRPEGTWRERADCLGDT